MPEKIILPKKVQAILRDQNDRISYKETEHVCYYFKNQHVKGKKKINIHLHCSTEPYSFNVVNVSGNDMIFIVFSHFEY